MFFEWLRGIGNAISSFWNEIDCRGCREMLDFDRSNQIENNINAGDNNGNDNNNNTNPINVSNYFDNIQKNNNNYYDNNSNVDPIEIKEDHDNDNKKERQSEDEIKYFGPNDKYVRILKNGQENMFFLNQSKYYNQDNVYTNYVNDKAFGSADYTDDLRNKKDVLEKFCENNNIDSSNIENIDLNDLLLFDAYSHEYNIDMNVLSAILMAKVNGSFEYEKIILPYTNIEFFADRLGVKLDNNYNIGKDKRDFCKLNYNKSIRKQNNSEIKLSDLNINYNQI